MSEEIVKEKIKEIMCKYELYNADFKEEIDSITFISLIVDIEDEFNIIIEEEKLIIREFANIDSITEYVLERR
ncbi:MAG: hypothetical protein K1W19_17885 [Lachnospiraceae bacterium]|jgi:Phosphopantetheine attachment site.|nr:hypothetical protein [Lachnospiraceae bacterium]MCI9371214.1 hypothetical protein [Lachnospiraceae bacterium]